MRLGRHSGAQNGQKFQLSLLISDFENHEKQTTLSATPTSQECGSVGNGQADGDVSILQARQPESIELCIEL